MNTSREEPFFDSSTILAIIAIVVGLPIYLLGTVFNKSLSLSDRILCGAAILPNLIYALFYLIIFAVAPFGFMVCCLASDAWPLGLMIGFFLVLIIISFFKNVLGVGRRNRGE